MARSKQKKTPQVRESAGLSLAKRVPPKAGSGAADGDDRHLIIRLNRVDVAGPWCLSRATGDQLREVLAAIKAFESMLAADVFRGYPGKDYGPAGSLPNQEAYQRVVDLGYDDQDISSLRVGGKGRLLGFRRARYFHVLWWDPEHEVYPSRKKHT